MDTINFKLSVFEGPLELLLQLISKNKLNIYDIPISEILEQYLACLDEMRSFNIEIASEFVAMASHLVYIKSKMLLPRYDDEKEEDPRAKLVEALLEYQRFKEMSGYLYERSKVGLNVFTKHPDTVEHDKTYNYSHQKEELVKAIRDIFRKNERRKPPPVTSFVGIVGKEIISVSSRVGFIIKKLLSEGIIELKELFKTAKTRSELVATFLAVLELCKDRKTVLNEDKEVYNLTLLNGETYGFERD